MYALEAKKKIATREFIKFLLMTPQFLSYAASCSGRANIPKINREQLFNFRLSIPSFAKQNEFSNQINKIQDQKIKLAESALHFDKLFSSLQQKVFREGV